MKNTTKVFIRLNSLEEISFNNKFTVRQHCLGALKFPLAKYFWQHNLGKKYFTYSATIIPYGIFSFYSFSLSQQLVATTASRRIMRIVLGEVIYFIEKFIFLSANRIIYKHSLVLSIIYFESLYVALSIPNRYPYCQPSKFYKFLFHI